MIQIKNYINGELLDLAVESSIDVYNPSIGKVFAQCPNSSDSDLNLAVLSGNKALVKWSSMSQDKRSRYLFDIADIIESRIDEFAKAESLDNGKPYKLSKSLDIPRSIKNLRFFASLAKDMKNLSFKEKNVINNIIRKPIGLVATISPWNLPLYLFTWKIAPALAMGNCVIAKPSEITPYSAYLFSEACIEAKLPPGVLNVLHGFGNDIGNFIVSHDKIKAISFTGGTKTGQTIARNASANLKKLSLEMGGKNPVIIFDDCNYDKMINSLLKSSFLNQGQICLAGSRIYIQDSIYKKFKNDFVSLTSELKVGDPFDPAVDQGAIVSENHLNKIKSYVKIAKSEGGSIIVGGDTVKLNGEHSLGWYFMPTIIEGLSEDSQVIKEEIFGPVVTLSMFKSEDEVISKSNNSDYGLASIIWTDDQDKANRLAGKLESGLVWINCWLERDLRTPFGGIKNSGFGKEGGAYAFDFFTESKNVCTKYYD